MRRRGKATIYIIHRRGVSVSFDATVPCRGLRRTIGTSRPVNGDSRWVSWWAKSPSKNVTSDKYTDYYYLSTVSDPHIRARGVHTRGPPPLPRYPSSTLRNLDISHGVGIQPSALPPLLRYVVSTYTRSTYTAFDKRRGPPGPIVSPTPTPAPLASASTGG